MAAEQKQEMTMRERCDAWGAKFGFVGKFLFGITKKMQDHYMKEFGELKTCGPSTQMIIICLLVVCEIIAYIVLIVHYDKACTNECK
jgi:hypothetical protein